MFNYKKLIGVLVGNTMQFYDFTIYAFLATQIGNEFFNFKDAFLSYLVVFLVFSGGYITRPMGSLIFGWIGDRTGRSRALSITIYFSMLATFLIGVIPGYKMLGIISPLILIILRLVQGLSVSGEEGGAAVLLFEGHSFKKTSVIGSLVLSSVLGGVILGMIICLIVTKLMSQHMIGEWAWRIPFLLSLPLGILGVWLRTFFSDSQLFHRAKNKGLVEKKPISILFKKYYLSVLYSIIIVSTYAVLTSTLIVHLPYLLGEKIGLGQQNALLILISSLLIIIFLTPYLGKVCNKYNAFMLYRVYMSLIVLLSPGIFYFICSGDVLFTIIGVLALSILIAAISSIIFVLLVGIFPFGVRYSGVSFSFNLSITIFSSTTPILLIFLEKYFGFNSIVGYYISFTSLIALLTIHLFKEKFVIQYFHKNNNEQNVYQLT